MNDMWVSFAGFVMVKALLFLMKIASKTRRCPNTLEDKESSRVLLGN
jgi:hypothetical protein